MVGVVKSASTLLLLVTFQCVASADLHESVFEPTTSVESFQTLAMIELEEHESTPTPPFSVCKYLVESTAPKVNGDDSWATVAKHIAEARATLPEHVRTACDEFIKANREGIMSLLQLSVQTQRAPSLIESIAELAQISAQQAQATPSPSPGAAPVMDQGDMFRQFWEEKGQYCGACLTITKKIQKWLSLNCTQDVIAERVMRMCATMPVDLRAQCHSNQVWVRNFVVNQLLLKFPLPNHCAYIGLCEKTMVIRALQNPMHLADQQNALIQNMEGTQPNLIQEHELVLQKPHETVTTAPEITFDLDNGDVSYRDVDRVLGTGLPKVYVDGSTGDSDTADAASLLEVQSESHHRGNNSIFDLSTPSEPRVVINAQDEDQIAVPDMHASLVNSHATTVSTSYAFLGRDLPIADTYLMGCAACQFTIGALFEFMSDPRTARIVLPAVKNACSSCNNPVETQKCQDFVENQGVAFYQDVVRQGSPTKWCPRLGLCEIQYFYPSPHVLPDAYSKISAQVLSVSDF